MIRQHAPGKPGGLQHFDLVASIAALPAACVAYEWSAQTHAAMPSATVLLVSVAVATLAWGAAAWVHQLYATGVGRSAAEAALRLLLTLGTVALVLGALAFAMKQWEIPRLLAGWYVLAVLVLTLSVRVVYRAFGSAATNGEGARRYAIVGGGAMAREVVETVEAHPEWGMELAGFISLDGSGTSRGPTLGEVSQLGSILERDVIDVVFFVVPRARLAEVERAVHVCEEFGVDVRIALDVLRFGPGRMNVEDLGGVPLLAFTRTPSDAIALLAKRAFDVTMSALVLLLLSPALVAVSVAIRLDSPGPIFFRQLRVGRNGRAFQMLKFRSMYRDAEARLEALRARNEMTGPVFKIKNDPRITKVGAFLRKTSLDEFPQFLNVLKGEMSIVGPRPPIPAEVRQYKRWQRRRLSMKPGITCIWQISGRNNIDFERWMELDLQYIDEWSLWGDIEICFRTIPAVLSARGAR
jgi:exopolysaccharide biosynthesis polyprenyl glycosylphosphotransferase